MAGKECAKISYFDLDLKEFMELAGGNGIIKLFTIFIATGLQFPLILTLGLAFIMGRVTDVLVAPDVYIDLTDPKKWRVVT